MRNPTYRQLLVLQAALLIVFAGTTREFPAGLLAQVPAVKFDVPATKGLLVSPVYEGWYQLGKTTYALFGYYNRNLEEVVDVPIGPNNRITPGPIDQGQPTRFFPGQHVGLFVVALPVDRSSGELTWTLTANGQTFSIPAFFDPLYLIMPQRAEAGTYPGNTPPSVKLDPSGAAVQGPMGITISRTATVSRPLAIDVWVTDDGLPPPPGLEGPAPALRGSAVGRARRGGLTARWRVYRGPGAASFSHDTPAIEAGKTHTMVTFSTAGDYMLHFVAMDSQSGNKCCWTNAYVKVAVKGAEAGG
jgi:hypothetical protein